MHDLHSPHQTVREVFLHTAFAGALHFKLTQYSLLSLSVELLSQKREFPRQFIYTAGSPVTELLSSIGTQSLLQKHVPAEAPLLL